jgi:DNA primase
MNAQELKDYLIEDIDRIKKVMESVGIHRIWQSGDSLRGAPEETENHTAISVNIDTLFCSYYKRDETLRADIIGLVQHLRDESFSDSFRFLTSLFGLSSSGKFVKETRRDPLAKFKDIRKKNKPVTSIDEIEVPKFGAEALADFIMIPHINLFHEGIMPQTAELFKICYDPKLDRILFPHFNYDDKNAIVGITGRTTRNSEEIQQLMIAKYWNYISGYKKMYNLFAFSHAIEFVKKHGMLVIFEAEKSVLKNFTQTRNEGYSCSIGGHEIADVQVQIIMRHLPTDIEVVIAFDKDVMRMIDKKTKKHVGEEYLIRMAEKFSKYRKTSYVYDSEDLLGDFDSPIDKGYKIWHELLNNRIVL